MIFLELTFTGQIQSMRTAGFADHDLIVVQQETDSIEPILAKIKFTKNGNSNIVVIIYPSNRRADVIPK